MKFAIMIVNVTSMNRLEAREMLKQGLEIGICGSGPRWSKIEEALRQQKGFRIRRLGDSLAEGIQEILMLSPHVVLFEIDQAEPATITAIMERLTGTKLIGLSAAGKAITLSAASERSMLSMAELTRVITEHQMSLAGVERRDKHAQS